MSMRYFLWRIYFNYTNMQSFLHANAVKGTALQRKLRNLTVIRYFPCIRLLKVANVNFMPSSCSLRYISCAHLFSTSSPSNSRTAYKAPKTYLFTPINLLPQMSRKSLNGSINEQTAKMAWKCWILKKYNFCDFQQCCFQITNQISKHYHLVMVSLTYQRSP